MVGKKIINRRFSWAEISGFFFFLLIGLISLPFFYAAVIDNQIWISICSGFS
jgi:hypothetical protein